MISGTIPTKDATGKPNGFVLPLWHVDSGVPIEQVYLTVIDKGCVKGPHLHHRRRGLFTCIRGAVKIVRRDCTGRYIATYIAPGMPQVAIAPGVPCALYNVGEGEAYVLNMPSPPWRANEPDEWPVEDWNPPCV